MSAGQKYPFTFDKVFTHEASQQDVFVEISQLVQSALDGYKVNLFHWFQIFHTEPHAIQWIDLFKSRSGFYVSTYVGPKYK